MDVRFRTLLGEERWSELPPSVRARFSKFAGPGTTVVYTGEVTRTELSRTGWLLAQLAWVIGSPLPRRNGATGPARVEVSGDGRGGQLWRRFYSDPVLGMQMIVSAKRFRGPTGLEEYVGAGIGMALVLAVEDQALVFRSQHFFLEIGRLRMRLPWFLSPGEMEITHRDEGNGCFTFSLALTHRWLGRVLSQVALFQDQDPG